MARWVFSEKKKEIQPEDLREKAVKPLISEINAVLQDGFNRGIEHTVPQAMKTALSENVFIFSGMKAYHVLKDTGTTLMDGDKIKPFNMFWQQAQAVHQNYQNYLQAEYIFATQSAQMASKWNEFEQDGDRYDLQYRTAGDDRVRDSHAALANTTLPPDDPFWSSYLPPNGWRCRCTTVQVRKGKYERSNPVQAAAAGEQATAGKHQDIFRFNPGKERRIFPDKHPYYPQGGCNTLAITDDEKCKAYQILKQEQKFKSKSILSYGKENIIGKYEFKHENFTATFTRNSFTENLKFGELFEAKTEILKDIKTYLNKSVNYKFELNNQSERKPEVIGYHKISTVYNGKDKKLAGRTVEFQFEDRGNQGTFFHFIKFLKD